MSELGTYILPFYGKCQGLESFKKNSVLPETAHAGLVFEKFPFMWWVKGSTERDHVTWSNTGESYNAPKKRKEKEPLPFPFLKSFCKNFEEKKKENQIALQEVHCRLARICGHRMGITHDFTSQWRFVTGLGAPHPLENGFTFDRAVGVPYLHGSSVKGVARAGAEYIMKAGEDPGKNSMKENIKRIFGPEGDLAREAPSAGSVIFLDAYPVDWPRLEPDVMTPHFGKYYFKGEPPSDYLEPTPIFFLTVASGTVFRFYVLQRTAETDMKDVVSATEFLKAGLSILGAGAKTAAGYGYFE